MFKWMGKEINAFLGAQNVLIRTYATIQQTETDKVYVGGSGWGIMISE